MTEVLARVRETVCALHEELRRAALVAWTSGNVSARVPDQYGAYTPWPRRYWCLTRCRPYR